MNRINSQPLVESTGGLEAPFSLRLIDELNDGDKLYVLGTVTSTVPWNAGEVLVRTSALKRGEPVSIVDYPLNQGVSKDGALLMKPGVPVMFFTSIASQGVSDYQVELLWGKEAQTEREKESIAGGALRLEKVLTKRDIQRCTGNSCGVKFEITGNLSNQTSSTLEKGVLGIALVKEVNPGSGPVTGKEERVELTGLRLAPGGTRELRLLYEKNLPKDQCELYAPSLRIISYE